MNCFAQEALEKFGKDPSGTMGASCQLPLLDTLVPLVVGLVCVVIVVLFAIAFTWLLVSTGRFTWSFSRLSRRLRMIRSRNEVMDEQKLILVGELLGKNRSTRHGWQEFSETLVHEQRGVLNTRPAQDFFPEHEIVEARIHLGFFDAVPSLLTGLGLFATFVALYLGLGGLAVPEGTGQIEGIPQFIQALSGKFLSSVLGLFTAVVFAFFKAFRVPRAHRVYRRFCESFDSLFDRITPEDLLRRLNEQSAEQSATLKHLATDISDRFREGMNENLKPPLERMIDLLQRSLEERTETFEKMASKLADTFRANFNQTTNFEFDHVTDALERTLTMVGRMEERAGESQRGFSELIGKLGQLQSSMGQVLENLEKAAGGLQQGGLDAQSKLLAAAESLSARVSTGATEATQALAGTAKTVIDHHAEQSTRIQQRLEALLEREEGRSELLTQQREAQREAIREFGGLLAESKASLEGLQLASAGARDAASIFQQAAGRVREVQDNARSLVDASGEQARDMRSVLDSNKNLLGEYERVFRTVDEGLSKTVKALGNELVRFQEDATEQLRRQLGVFDEHLGAATDKLGSAVQDLGERLEDASETIANSVDRAGPRRE